MKAAKLIINILFVIIWLLPSKFVFQNSSRFGDYIYDVLDLPYVYSEWIVLWLPLVIGLSFFFGGSIFFSRNLWFSNSKSKKHSNADEVKKYADLRDKGILTEEEFQAKKKKLLDL